VINKTGSPYMTKGGFGDTLAGVCGALWQEILTLSKLLLPLFLLMVKLANWQLKNMAKAF